MNTTLCTDCWLSTGSIVLTGSGGHRHYKSRRGSREKWYSEEWRNSQYIWGEIHTTAAFRDGPDWESWELEQGGEYDETEDKKEKEKSGN